MVRRHHPLEGRRLEVLAERGKELDVRLRDGTTMRIPRRWTDADGSPGSPAASPDAVFTIDSLRTLIDLVRAFRGRE